MSVEATGAVLLEHPVVRTLALDGVRGTVPETMDVSVFDMPGMKKKVAIFPLAIPMLAGPAAIMSVMVVSADFSGSMVTSLIGYGALMAVMLATGLIMVLTAIAERIIDPRLSNVFSRVTAIILAALSVQYVIDGLAALQLITSP